MLRLVIVTLSLAMVAGAPLQGLSAGYLSIMDCDEINAPCPSGMYCLYNRILPTTRGCYNVDKTSQKRTGVCPLPDTLDGNSGGNRCSLNSDCQPDERCCSTKAGTAVCTAQLPAPSGTKVTVIRDGYSKGNDDGSLVFKTTIVAIQSNGKNYVLDVGGNDDGLEMLQALRDKVGLYADDIYASISSHAHPDHMNTIFEGIPYVVEGGYYVNGTVQVVTPDGWNLFDDPNIKVLNTQGHSALDITLIVSNEETYGGTVAVVGDTVLYEGDAAIKPWNNSFNSTIALAGRQKATCNVDYVVPGHGPTFKMTDELKQAYGCP